MGQPTSPTARRRPTGGPIGGHVVRLGWLDSLPAGLLTAIYADGRRIDLFTVPPTADPTAAEAALDLAASLTNRLRTPELLTTLAAPAGTRGPAGA